MTGRLTSASRAIATASVFCLIIGMFDMEARFVPDLA
jgi:hypothetical protein